MTKPVWRYSEVFRNLDRAKEYVETNNIKNYDVVIIWD